MKKWIILLIMYMCIILGGCQTQTNYTVEKWEADFSNYISVEHSEKEGNFNIISRSSTVDTIIPGKYLIDSNLIADEYTLRDKKKHLYRPGVSNELKELDIRVYDIQTMTLIKKVDFALIIEPYLNNWMVYDEGFGIGKKEDKYYLIKTLKKRQTIEEIIDDKPREYKNLWFDIETEMVALRNNLEDEESYFVSEGNDNNIWMLVGTSILSSNGMENTHVRNSGYLENTSLIKIPTKHLPKKNKKLYSLFPKLKTVSREEGIYAKIYLYPQTNNLEAISLILEDGELLDFDKLETDDKGYYGGYGIDGEIHDITKEEYEQFQKDYYEYMEKEEEKAEQ